MTPPARWRSRARSVGTFGALDHLGAGGVALHIGRLAARLGGLRQVIGAGQHAIAVGEGLRLASVRSLRKRRAASGGERVEEGDAVMQLGRKDQVVGFKDHGLAAVRA